MLRIIMIFIAVILMTLIVTQVLKPVFTGEQLFPMFRRTKKTTSSRLREAEIKLANLKAEKKINELEAKALRIQLENQAITNDVLDEFIDNERKV